MDIRQELTDFYRLHNPAKLRDVDGLLVTFKGRERALLRALHQKYRSASAGHAAASEDSTRGSSVVSATPVAPTRASPAALDTSDGAQQPSAAAAPTHGEATHAMRQLLEQMTAIDLAALAARLSGESTTGDAPLLTHTIRYLQHFLACAKDFAELARRTVDGTTTDTTPPGATTHRSTADAATMTDVHATRASGGTQTEACAARHDAVTQTTAVTTAATQTNADAAPPASPLGHARADVAPKGRATSVAVQTQDTHGACAQPPLRPVPTLPRQHELNTQAAAAAALTKLREEEGGGGGESDTSAAAAVRRALRPLSTPSPLLRLPRSRPPGAVPYVMSAPSSSVATAALPSPLTRSPPSSSSPLLRMRERRAMDAAPSALALRRGAVAEDTLQQVQHAVMPYGAALTDATGRPAPRVHTFVPSPIPGAGVIGPALRSGAVRLCPGDTIVLRAGTYYENVWLERCGEVTLTSEFAGAAVVLRPAVHTEPVLGVHGPACHLTVVNIRIVGDDTTDSERKIYGGDEEEESEERSSVATDGRGAAAAPRASRDGDVRERSTSAASLVMAQAGARISLRGCDVCSAASAAVVAAEDGTVVRLRRCRLTRCGLSAVYARRAARVELHECDVTHCAVGLCAAQRASVSLEQCRVTGSETDGVVLLDAATATLARTTIARSGSNGVLVSADAELWLLQSVVEANGMYGVQRFQGARVHLADATLRANGLLDLSEETPQLLPSRTPLPRSSSPQSSFIASSIL